MHLLRRRFFSCLAISAFGLLAACEEPNRYVAPPPPQVAVANPLRTNVIG